MRLCLGLASALAFGVESALAGSGVLALETYLGVGLASLAVLGAVLLWPLEKPRRRVPK